MMVRLMSEVRQIWILTFVKKKVSFVYIGIDFSHERTRNVGISTVYP